MTSVLSENLIKTCQWLIVLSAFAISLPTPIIGITTGLFMIGWLVLLAFSPDIRLSLIKTISKNSVAKISLFLWLLIGAGITWSSASWGEALNIFGKYRELLLIPLMLTLMTRKWSMRILYAFLIGYVISLALSYTQWAGFAPLSRDNLPSGFHTRIQLGTLEAFSLYVCSILLILKTNPNLRNLYIILIGASLFNLLFINTGRSGYIVFALLFFILQFLLWRWKGLVLATLAMALGVLVLYQYSPNLHERVKNTTTEITEINSNLNKENVHARSTLWINAITIIQRNPVFGSGTGSYPIEYKEISNGAGSKNPHQQFLLTWAEQGLLGLLLLLYLLYTQWQTAKAFPQPDRYLAYGFLVTFIVHSLFNSSIMDNLEGHFYALMTVAFWGNEEDMA